MRSNTASQTRCKTAGKTQIVEDVKMKCSIDSKMFQRAHAILNTVPEADQEAVGWARSTFSTKLQCGTGQGPLNQD